MKEFKEVLETGDKVVRGPHWTWGNQDGGKGSIGTVIERDEADWYVVRWPSDEKNAYVYEDGTRQIILFEPPKEEKEEAIKEPERTVKIKRKNANN